MKIRSDTITGTWKQYMGEVKNRWGKLTDDEILEINGDREILADKLQERYGIAKEDANKQIDKWADKLKVQSLLATVFRKEIHTMNNQQRHSSRQASYLAEGTEEITNTLELTNGWERSSIVRSDPVIKGDSAKEGFQTGMEREGRDDIGSQNAAID